MVGNLGHPAPWVGRVGAVPIFLFATAIACAAVGGIFFAFSGFVMTALRRLSPADGIRAMQAINVAAVRPPLMLAMLGTAALVVAGALWALLAGSASALVAAVGAIAYLALVIALTGGFHVPRNIALGSLDPTAPEAAERWERHASTWTRANHLRALGGILAGGAFALAGAMALG